MADVYISLVKGLNRDKAIAERLRTHIAARCAHIKVWSANDLQPGNRKSLREEHRDSAHCAVLLLSHEYFADPWIRDEELPRLLERAGRGLEVIPVCVSPVDYQTHLSDIEVLELCQDNGKPFPPAQLDSIWKKLAGQVCDCAETGRAPLLGRAPVRIRRLIQGVLFVLACFLAYRMFEHFRKPVPIEANVVTVACTDTTLEWMKSVADPLHIQCEALPSREARQIMRWGNTFSFSSKSGTSTTSEKRSLLFAPADTYQTGKLDDTILEPSSTLVHSRLVLVMTPKRAAEFEILQKRSYPGDTWRLLHDLAEYGWDGLAGRQQRTAAPFHIAIADPVKSHSGLGALSLIFAEFSRLHPGATTSNPEFLKFLKTFAEHQPQVIDDAWQEDREMTQKQRKEARIRGKVSYDRTGQIVKLLAEDTTDSVDVAVGYEANVYQELRAHPNALLRVVYPTTTLDVPFPIAIRTYAKADDGERTRYDGNHELAKRFIDALQNDRGTALTKYGFRIDGVPDSTLQVPFSSNAMKQAGFVVDSRHDTSIELEKLMSTLRTGNMKYGQVLDDLPAEWLHFFPPVRADPTKGSTKGK